MRKPSITKVCPVCSSIFHPTPSAVANRGAGWCSRECADIGRREPMQARFWRQVDKTPGQGPNGKCWIWTGLRHRQGYGKLWDYQGRIILAHRFSWELHNGPIPSGKLVCHDCDNPPCVNPEELFIGTHKSNMQDKIAKGRAGECVPINPCKGEQHHHATLTEEIVAEIRRMASTGSWSQAQIGNKFGTSQTNVSMIIRNKAWRKK